MKCARCLRDRLTSAVVFLSDDAKPWTQDAVSKDVHGRRHVHDPNDCAVMYTCGLGHNWTRRSAHPCWCGWSKYLADNTPFVRVFCEMSCWVGEDNFILMGQKGYKGYVDVRLETETTPEIDDILLEYESPFCSLLRGAL